MSNKNGDYYFLRGGGEMGELMRAKDWSKTALGDPAGWPPSLCTMVAVMLENPFGMYIAWGTDYTQLYNDAYRPILGATKHPDALGISTRETFSEIWHIIESMFDGVMEGKAVGFPDFMLPLNRNGFVEECFFDFSYSPIRKHNGEVGGVLVTVLETTNKKKAEDAAKESDQRFRDTVQQAPVGITILRGADHVVEIANEAYLKLVNRTETEFVGRPLFEALPEVKEAVQPLLDGVLTTGIPYHGNEMPVPVHRYGKEELLYFDFLYYPLKERDGSISGIIVTVTEVSDKVAAVLKIKQNENLLQTIFVNAPAAIAVITGPEHTYVLANKEYQKMVGRTPAQLLGKTSKSIFPELVGSGTFEIFDTIYLTGEPFSLAEYPARLDKNSDGHLVQMYFRFSAVPLKDEAGHFDSLAIVAVDISEQVLARKKIEESEKRFQLLVRDAAAAIVVLTGPEMKVEIVNEAYGRLIALTADELLGKHLFSVIPEAADYYLPMLERVRQTGEMLRLHDSPYAVTVNGQHIEGYLHVLYQPYRNTEGDIIGVMAILQDVTESVLARKKLEESEQRFQAAVAAVQGVLWTNNGKGEMEGEQPGWAALTGQTQEEYQGVGWARAIHPDDAQPTLDAWNEAVREQKPFIFEHRLRIHDGGWRNFSVRAIPLIDSACNVHQWVGVHTDITEQHAALQGIKESEERFHNLIFSSPSGIGILEGEDLVITIANEPILEIWGKGKEIIGQKYFEALPELVEQGYKEVYARVYKTGLPFTALETPVYLLQNGKESLKYYNFILYPQRNINNEVNGIGIIASEVTSQALLNNRMKESEERFRSLAHTLPQLVWVADNKGHSEFTSARWEEYSGIKPSGEAEWKAIVHPHDLDSINAAWSHSLATGDIYSCDVRLKNKAGEYRWHHVTGEPVLDKYNHIVKWVGAFTDIHEQRIKDERKDEFMSIASHELKTPVTTAKGYLQILEEVLEDTDPSALRFAKKAGESVNKLTDLISELLDASKIRLGKLHYTISTFDFNSMLDSTVENIQLISPKHTIIKTGTTTTLVTGDKDRLQQVVINLLTNAVKYSPDQEKLFLHVAQDAQKIRVSVKDSGIGIAPENLDKIFERYHRVDEHAIHFQGLGIGLFISSEIVQRHGGELWAESEAGKGSTFYFTIPIMPDARINEAGG
ncbi:MAG: PAS domain S-box protein [Chitinophagaceae bacterium]|nr:MAG: PAS domain S-box protein [Chitinophagaceae bacterium]